MTHLEEAHSRPALFPEERESDGQLLDRFILHQDQSAFEEIVRRHGVMVLGVCKRVLDNRHDAEDCFQAVFMVLVRKATSIEPRDMVGNWLYGVAYRTALEARKLAARRRNHEKKKHAMPKPESNAELWSELRPVLDQELSKLPDRYRFVLVASDLEGKTRAEVADLLGVPEGTVASRLSRARAMLAKRLQKHRLIVSPTLLASLLAKEAAPAVLPESLVASVSRSAMTSKTPSRAATIADAVMQAMFWSKLKLAGAALCVLALIGLSIASFPKAAAEHCFDVAASKELPEKPREYIIRKIDVAKGKIVAESLAGDDGEKQKIELKLDPDSKLIVNGNKVKIMQVAIGMIVQVHSQRDSEGQLHLRRLEAVAQMQSITGVVREVDADNVTIEPEVADGVAEAFTVDTNAAISVDGKSSKLQDVRKGTRVSAEIREGRPQRRVFAINSPPRKP